MDRETQLWNQYVGLREEIKAADALCYQVLGIVIAAVTTILTASLGQANPHIRFWTFLCVYIITIPAYSILEGKRRSIWRISTYTRVFLEPGLQFIKWESRLDLQRSNASKKGGEDLKQSFSSLASTNEWVILRGLNWVAALAAIFDGLWTFHDIGTPIKIMGSVAIVILNIILTRKLSLTEYNLRRLGQIEQNYLASWDKILNPNISLEFLSSSLQEKAMGLLRLPNWSDRQKWDKLVADKTQIENIMATITKESAERDKLVADKTQIENTMTKMLEESENL